MNFAKPSVLSDALKTAAASVLSLPSPLDTSTTTALTPSGRWQGASAASAIAFIDGSVADYQTLVAGVAPGTEVHILDSSQDAVTQITNTLLGRHNISSLHIVSHGEAGGLDFGTGKLNLKDLPEYAAQLQSWSNALTDDADLLLYGCNVGKGELGQAFVKILNQLTGADVAASDDLTGSASKGGNWTLEVNTGEIETDLAFQSETTQRYIATLDATYHNLAGGSFSQDWSNTGLITTNDNWSGVPSIIGYLGQDLTTAIGTDPQTILTPNSAVANDLDVIAEQPNPNILTQGGVAEFQISNPTVALQPSATADAPYLLIHLNTTGVTNPIAVSYNLRDIDGATDNAIQPIALQYRVGTTGNFTNVSTAYVADASTGPNLATLVTPVNVTLPAAVNNQAQVQLRIMTANAPSIDEWIGIDDIKITSTVASLPTVNLNTSTANITEGNTGTFTIDRGSNTTSALTVNLTIDGTSTAILGSSNDYTLDVGGTPVTVTDNSLSVTIPDTQSSVTLNMAALAEAIGFAEAADLLKLNLAAGTGYDIGSNNTASITIAANGFSVDTTNDSGEGSLRQAMLNANAIAGADTITFAGSTFTDATPDTITLTSGQLGISSDLTLQGTGATLLTISGNNAFRVFNIGAGANVTINALTISEGNLAFSSSDDDNYYGGGIYNNGTLNVSNSTLSGNSASRGGGIYTNGTLNVSNSTLSGNTASRDGGGGIWNNFGTVSLTNSTLSGNTAPNNGGGIVINLGTVSLTNSTLSSNTSGNFGGGIDNNGNLTVSNSTFSGNTATNNGGALWNFNTLALSNSTFSGNTATNGGGLYNNTNGTITSLSNSTFSGNTTGIFNAGAITTITNSTLAGNGNAGIFNNGAIANLYNNLFVSNGTDTVSGTINNQSNNLFGTFATLGVDSTLRNNGGLTQTHGLLPGSNAINTAGANATTADQRGIATSGGIRDVGAFESRGFNISIVGGNNQSTTTNTAFTNPLAVNVTSSFGESVTGGKVFFIPPGSGATATLTGTPATIDASGNASATATANNSPGSYTVNAGGGGFPVLANFSLTNIPPNALPTSANKNITFNEDALYTFSPADFAFTDTDGGTFTSIKITQLPTVGQLFLDNDSDNLQGTGEAIAANQVLAVADLGKLKFKPAADANGTNYTSFQFQVNDGTSFSTSYTATLNVTAVNDAPVLTDTNVVLAAVNEDAGAPTGAVGTLVSALVDLNPPVGGLNNVTDGDAGAVTGIAITAADTTIGTWFYSTNNGTNWSALGTVANTTARLLAADANTRVYFQPTANANGTVTNALTFRAWDTTSGTNGNTADTSTNSGTTAFSTVTDTASLTVNAVNDAPILSVLSNSLNLDGINDYARTTAPITHNQNFTYEAWVKFPTNNPGWSGIITTSTLAGSGGFVQFSNNGSGRLRAEISGSSTFNVDGTISMSDGNWHHVALTYNGASLKTYVDGALDINSSVNQTFNVNRQVFIGAERQLSAGWTPVGQIAEVRIWNVTRTQAEIQANRNQAIAPNSTGLIGYWQLNQNSGTTANDLSSSGLNATLLNGATWATNSPLPGNIPLTAINEDAGAPTGAVGTLVSALVDLNPPVGGFDNVTDGDTGAVTGIAITAANTTNGTWFYSTTNGTNWTALGTVANTTARLLAADANTRVYFQPNANYNGTVINALTFRAWDTTSGTNGNTADTSTNGGTTAFSTAIGTASFTITEVNDAPVATNDALGAVAEDSSIRTITFASLLGNDSTGPANESTQTLTITALSNVVGGTAVINGTNIEFTPTLDYNGAASFDYTVQDNGTTNSVADPRTATAIVSFTINAVNDAPSFTKGLDQIITTGAGIQTIPNWATEFKPGPTDEASQTVQAYIVNVDTNPGIFAVAPAIDAFGNLTYTPATNVATTTTATISVKVQDSGGIANGGVDTSTPQTFTITVKPQPTISITPISQNEGNSGTTTYTFTANLNDTSTQEVRISYATADSTATTADGDYSTANGTLIFAPGETSKTFTVNTNGDTKYETTEAFLVNLSNAVNGAIVTGSTSVNGTITNDDSAPTVNITPTLTQAEGSSGPQPYTFTVTLSNPSDQAIALNYNTVDDTATTADGDYTTATGTVTFAPGDTSKTITVNATGDTKFETDETFQVTLSPVTGTGAVTPGTPTSSATITNDDVQPTINIGNVSQNEGNNGTTAYTFTVNLSNASAQTVSLNYATADGTATVTDSDYVAANGTLSFAPGETSKTITVLANGDTKFETDQTFSVELSNASNGTLGTLGTSTATGTIVNDDTRPTLSINNVSQAEGRTGTTAYTFTVNLSNTSDETVTVSYTTADGTATVANNDYTAATNTLTFNPGETSKPLAVNANGDTRSEQDETFVVNLSAPANATIATGTGTGTIVNDDRVNLVWRNGTTGTAPTGTGENVIWQMNGFTYQSDYYLPRVADLNWQIVGRADFNRDGNTDLLWRNRSTGENAIWELSNFTLQSAYFIPAVGSVNWQIASTADFNLDGKPDILWRNRITGENVIWQLNGAALQSDYFLTTTDINWQIADTADFNNDGTADILWRNRVTGENVVWQLNNFRLQTFYHTLKVADQNWQIAGTGDFNNDGIADIVWHHKETGANVIWQMNSTGFQRDYFIRTAANINWQIAGIADFNGDGTADLLWRNVQSNQEEIWQMNGFSYAQTYQLPGVAREWVVKTLPTA